MARPRKMKNARASVIVVKNTPEAMAGSIFILDKISGITVPASPATNNVPITAEANTKLKLRLP